MARYKQINWKDPIWETQEKEPPREAHYKDLFLKFNGTLTDFAEEYLPQLWNEFKSDSKELQKFFDKYDIKKGQPPTFSVIMSWSKFFYWLERRRAYKNSITEETREFLRDTQISLLNDYINNLKKIVPESLDAQVQNMKVLLRILFDDEVNAHMVKSHTEANLNLEEYLRKALGLDETSSSSADDLNNTDGDESIIPVPDNPEHENKETYAEINKTLWDLVNQK